MYFRDKRTRRIFPVAKEVMSQQFAHDSEAKFGTHRRFHNHLDPAEPFDAEQPTSVRPPEIEPVDVYRGARYTPESIANPSAVTVVEGGGGGGGGSGLTGVGTPNRVPLWSGTTSLTNSPIYYVSTSGGRIGIRNANPQTVLDVAGTVKATGLQLDTGGAVVGYQWTATDTDGNGSWQPAGGSGSGEANTGSNVGTDGVGVFDGKVGVDLQFRNIASVSAPISVNLDAAQNDIDISFNPGSVEHHDLSGLNDDDHTQYHNDARGDARYYTQSQLDAGQLDTRYYTESEHLNVSAGAGDAGKPVVLDAGGHIDASMVNAGDIDITGTTGTLGLARGGTAADLSSVTANALVQMNAGQTALVESPLRYISNVLSAPVSGLRRIDFNWAQPEFRGNGIPGANFLFSNATSGQDVALAILAGVSSDGSISFANSAATSSVYTTDNSGSAVLVLDTSPSGNGFGLEIISGDLDVDDGNVNVTGDIDASGLISGGTIEQGGNPVLDDTTGYLQSAFIATSAGAGDAGKPIVLDAAGHIDASMLNSGDVDHTAIQNIGTNTHAQIDTHIADSTIHFTEGSISHTNITNIGTNTHAQIDAHIASTANPHSLSLTSLTDVNFKTGTGTTVVMSTSPLLITPSLDVPTITNSAVFRQEGAPSNPGSAYQKAYVNLTTGLLTLRDSAGRETPCGVTPVSRSYEYKVQTTLPTREFLLDPGHMAMRAAKTQSIPTGAGYTFLDLRSSGINLSQFSPSSWSLSVSDFVDSATGYLEFPAEGKWLVTVIVVWQANSTGDRELLILTDGTIPIFARDIRGAAKAWESTNSATFVADGASKYALAVRQSSGGALNVLNNLGGLYQTVVYCTYLGEYA